MTELSELTGIPELATRKNKRNTKKRKVKSYSKVKKSKGQRKLLDELYEVRIIKEHRVRDGKTEYLVGWEGYGDSEDTWEPKENIAHTPPFKNYEDELFRMIRKIHSKQRREQLRKELGVSEESDTSDMEESKMEEEEEAPEPAAVQKAAASDEEYKQPEEEKESDDDSDDFKPLKDFKVKKEPIEPSNELPLKDFKVEKEPLEPSNDLNKCNYCDRQQPKPLHRSITQEKIQVCWDCFMYEAMNGRLPPIEAKEKVNLDKSQKLQQIRFPVRREEASEKTMEIAKAYHGGVPPPEPVTGSNEPRCSFCYESSSSGVFKPSIKQSTLILCNACSWYERTHPVIVARHLREETVLPKGANVHNKGPRCDYCSRRSATNVLAQSKQIPELFICKACQNYEQRHKTIIRASHSKVNGETHCEYCNVASSLLTPSLTVFDLNLCSECSHYELRYGVLRPRNQRFSPSKSPSLGHMNQQCEFCGDRSQYLIPAKTSDMRVCSSCRSREMKTGRLKQNLRMEVKKDSSNSSLNPTPPQKKRKLNPIEFIGHKDFEAKEFPKSRPCDRCLMISTKVRNRKGVYFASKQFRGWYVCPSCMTWEHSQSTDKIANVVFTSRPFGFQIQAGREGYNAVVTDDSETVIQGWIIFKINDRTTCGESFSSIVTHLNKASLPCKVTFIKKTPMINEISPKAPPCAKPEEQTPIPGKSLAVNTSIVPSKRTHSIMSFQPTPSPLTPQSNVTSPAPPSNQKDTPKTPVAQRFKPKDELGNFDPPNLKEFVESLAHRRNDNPRFLEAARILNEQAMDFISIKFCSYDDVKEFGIPRWVWSNIRGEALLLEGLHNESIFKDPKEIKIQIK